MNSFSKKIITLVVLLTFNVCVSVAQDALLAEIKMFAGNFAPRGWAFCEGQLMNIAQNQALFSLLGTTYGGDGITTFALPDLRGRVVIGAGQGPGLSNYEQGNKGGTEQVPSLAVDPNNPSHVFTSGNNSVLGVGNTSTSSAQHNNMQPYTAIRYIIATEGIYPTRP